MEEKKKVILKRTPADVSPACSWCGKGFEIIGLDFHDPAGGPVCGPCAERVDPELHGLWEEVKKWWSGELQEMHRAGVIEGRRQAAREILRVTEETPIQRIRRACVDLGGTVNVVDGCREE